MTLAATSVNSYENRSVAGLVAAKEIFKLLSLEGVAYF